MNAAWNAAGAIRVGRWLAIAGLSLGVIGMAGTVGSGVRARDGRMEKLPRVTVWAWERREDLRALDVRTTALAYLDRTVVVDRGGVWVVPRREGILLPAADGLVRIAVVRVEVAGGIPLDAGEGELVAHAVAAASAERGIAALQVDFDARQSEREWYAGVLRRVRTEMPQGMPLSMTALASWCSYDGAWIRGLPVDEAVPMLFRMEPDRRRLRAADGTDEFAIREPLCMDSVGISTTESWPRTDGLRVYVFPDRGWARDGLAETVRSLQ